MIIVVPPQAAARVPVSKVSGRRRAPKGHLHVGVGVDAAGQDVLARRVDDEVGRLACARPATARPPTGPGRQRRHLLVLDQHVRRCGPVGGDKRCRR